MKIFFLFVLLALTFPAWGEEPLVDSAYTALKSRIVAGYSREVPREWGERVTGVKTRIATKEKVIALTFDACGSPKGMGFDETLIGFLEKEQIPATLFINSRWIGHNRAAFDRLASNPLFEIANHGFEHKPASVNGKSAYGIQGTRSVEELVNEIERGAREIESITGRKPLFYRSGTAFYDEVAVAVAALLGEQVAGFSVLGDAGATWPRKTVAKALLSVAAGDIVILHMNHPESGTAGGVVEAIPELKRRGFRFIRLADHPLK